MKNLNIRSVIFWTICIFFLSYIAIFYNLDKPAIRIWDEAIYANNALEMAINKNYLVLLNNGEASLYNTKPPLAIWLQSGFIQLLGPTTLAVRLPSALAGLFTCVLLFFFTKRHISTVAGLFAILFLITSTGFIKTHAVRTGDLDSLLVFFISAYTLLFFDFLLRSNVTKKETRWYIYGTAILFLAAYMTKSTAALLPLPGLFICMLVLQKTKAILTNPHTYFAFISAILLCIVYYYFREQASPGYWEKVVSSEFSRFNHDIMPWHNQPYWYYIKVWRDYDFVHYVWLLPLCVSTLFSPYLATKKIGLIGITFSLSLFFLLSHPFIKIHWYAAPLFPIMCLLLALTLNMLYEFFVKLKIFESKKWMVLVFCFSLFTYPYYCIYKSNLNYLPNGSLELDGYAVRKLAKQSPNLKSYKIFSTFDHPSHVDAVNFYIKSLNHYHDYELKLINNIDQIKIGDLILTSQEDKRQLLISTFSLKQTHQIHQSTFYTVISRKNPYF